MTLRLIVIGVSLTLGVSARVFAGGGQLHQIPAPTIPTPKGPRPRPVIVTHLNVSDAVVAGQLKTYAISVFAGRSVVIRTFSSQDVDLYAQMNAVPTTHAYLVRAQTTSGNETLRYTPASNGTLYVGVYGYQAASFTLRTANQ